MIHTAALIATLGGTLKPKHPHPNPPLLPQGEGDHRKAGRWGNIGFVI